jgi:seryl-tRNA synthetase
MEGANSTKGLASMFIPRNISSQLKPPLTSPGSSNTFQGKRRADPKDSTEELVKECLKKARTEAKLEIGEAFRTKIAGLETQITDLKGELKTSQARVESLEKKLNTIMTEMANLKAQNSK